MGGPAFRDDLGSALARIEHLESENSRLQSELTAARHAQSTPPRFPLATVIYATLLLSFVGLFLLRFLAEQPMWTRHATPPAPPPVVMEVPVVPVARVIPTPSPTDLMPTPRPAHYDLPPPIPQAPDLVVDEPVRRSTSSRQPPVEEARDVLLSNPARARQLMMRGVMTGQYPPGSEEFRILRVACDAIHDEECSEFLVNLMNRPFNPVESRYGY